jgi:hypothetical protein
MWNYWTYYSILHCSISHSPLFHWSTYYSTDSRNSNLLLLSAAQQYPIKNFALILSSILLFFFSVLCQTLFVNFDFPTWLWLSEWLILLFLSFRIAYNSILSVCQLLLWTLSNIAWTIAIHMYVDLLTFKFIESLFSCIIWILITIFLDWFQLFSYSLRLISILIWHHWVLENGWNSTVKHWEATFKAI